MTATHLRAVAISASLVLLPGCTDVTPDVAWPEVRTAVPRDSALEGTVAVLLARMTLEQKVGQMLQAEIQNVTPDDVRQYHLGSVLNGGGAFPGGNRRATLADWVALADAYYDASMDTTGGRLAIPIIWGTARRARWKRSTSTRSKRKPCSNRSKRARSARAAAGAPRRAGYCAPTAIPSSRRAARTATG